MNSQRPYFPFDTIEVPSYSYPRFDSENVCGWNMFIEQVGCVNTDWVGTKLFMKVEWLEPLYERTQETLENGLSETEVIISHSKVFYGFSLTADEYAFWYLYRLMFTNNEISFNSVTEDESESITGRNIKIEFEKAASGVYNIELRFQGNEDDTYHGSFGFKGCCNSLYEESPYEGCAEDDGAGIPGDNPECDEVTFSINENDGILETDVSGTPSTFTLLWSFRRTENDAWQQLGTASSISLGAYGIYRATLNALGCGIYTDQFIYLDPCEGFDVIIRTTNSNGLVAEVNVGNATFQWQYNDGTNDQWDVLSETSNSIMPTQTGNYRVIASFNDCEDSDIYYVKVNDCGFEVSINIDGDNAYAVTDAENPDYQWNFENENGQVLLSNNNSVPLTETGIYWLIVNEGDCFKSTYIYHRANDDCQKIEICNWDEMPVPQTTLIACCDGCPTLSLSITCVNRTLTVSGVPNDATVDWEGPNGFTGMGNPISFPSETPSGAFTATITVAECTYTAIYNYIMPNAGTPQQGIVI